MLVEQIRERLAAAIEVGGGQFLSIRDRDEEQQQQNGEKVLLHRLEFTTRRVLHAIIRGMRKLTTVTVSLLFIASVAVAQDAPKKPLSPPAQAKATIGGKIVTIDYNAPSKRGREIMGALVPYGKVWRTGANAATTLTTDGDLMIGKLHVPAGKYTLYTIPGAKEWTLIVNKQTGQWGTNHDAEQDLGRVTMNVKPVKDAVETFRIDLAAKGAKAGVLTMQWENVEASAPVMAH